MSWIIETVNDKAELTYKRTNRRKIGNIKNKKCSIKITHEQTQINIWEVSKRKNKIYTIKK